MKKNTRGMPNIILCTRLTNNAAFLSNVPNIDPSFLDLFQGPHRAFRALLAIYLADSGPSRLYRSTMRLAVAALGEELNHLLIPSECDRNTQEDKALRHPMSQDPSGSPKPDCLMEPDQTWSWTSTVSPEPNHAPRPRQDPGPRQGSRPRPR